MNERTEQCLYKAGLTAQGCWDELDDYAKQGIEKFAELILLEVYDILSAYRNKVIFDDGFEYNCEHPIQAIQKHFGEKR
jgi:hypothetical protein